MSPFTYRYVFRVWGMYVYICTYGATSTYMVACQNYRPFLDPCYNTLLVFRARKTGDNDFGAPSPPPPTCHTYMYICNYIQIYVYICAIFELFIISCLLAMKLRGFLPPSLSLFFFFYRLCETLRPRRGGPRAPRSLRWSVPRTNGVRGHWNWNWEFFPTSHYVFTSLPASTSM